MDFNNEQSFWTYGDKKIVAGQEHHSYVSEKCNLKSKLMGAEWPEVPNTAFGWWYNQILMTVALRLVTSTDLLSSLPAQKSSFAMGWNYCA